MMTPDEKKLFERIIRAKIKLEAARKRHDGNCMIELDPDYMGECTCGSTSANRLIDSVLEELDP